MSVILTPSWEPCWFELSHLVYFSPSSLLIFLSNWKVFLMLIKIFVTELPSWNKSHRTLKCLFCYSLICRSSDIQSTLICRVVESFKFVFWGEKPHLESCQETGYLFPVFHVFWVCRCSFNVVTLFFVVYLYSKLLRLLMVTKGKYRAKYVGINATCARRKWEAPHKLGQFIRCSSRYSNRVLPEYKSQVLPLQPACSVAVTQYLTGPSYGAVVPNFPQLIFHSNPAIYYAVLQKIRGTLG